MRQYPVIAVLFVLLAAAPPAFAGDLPRGPGFYFSLWKSLLLVAVYLIWLYACWWVNRDAERVDLDRHTWNGIAFGGGVLGLLVFWLIPFFPLSFPAMAGTLFAAVASYIGTRNAAVPPSRQVWTKRHFALLLQHYFHINMGVREEKEKKRRKGPDVRFAPRWDTEFGRDPPRLRQVQGKRGYRTARDLVAEAIARRATNIVLEPTKSKLAVRYRIDGVLQPGDSLPKAQGLAVCRILKLLGELPADAEPGREVSLPLEIGKQRGELRLRVEEVQHGEKLSMQLRERNRPAPQLPKLGFSPVVLDQLNYLLTQSKGVFLVTGPEEAGVTTTLKACLVALDPQSRSVLALESPVEQKLPWIEHVTVARRRGEPTAPGVKRVLGNQTADVILIGNCDEPEVAVLAFQKAAERMLIFGRMTAPDSVSALLKLLDFGIPAKAINKLLLGVLAQRLVRILCPECKVSYKPNPEVLRKANLPADKIRYLQRPPEESERPRGDDDAVQICEHCGGTGFYERSVVCELLRMSERMREILETEPSRNALREEAVRSGMAPLSNDALRLLAEGTTSAQEIMQYLR